MKTYPLFNWAQRHKDVWGSEGIAHVFLTSTLDRCEWSASRSARFTPGERTPGTHWTESWVGPRAGLEAVGSNCINTVNRSVTFNTFSNNRSINTLTMPTDVRKKANRTYGGEVWAFTLILLVNWCVTFTWRYGEQVLSKCKEFRGRLMEEKDTMRNAV